MACKKEALQKGKCRARLNWNQSLENSHQSNWFHLGCVETLDWRKLVSAYFKQAAVWIINNCTFYSKQWIPTKLHQRRWETMNTTTLQIWHLGNSKRSGKPGKRCLLTCEIQVSFWQKFGCVNAPAGPKRTRRRKFSLILYIAFDQRILKSGFLLDVFPQLSPTQVSETFSF